MLLTTFQGFEPSATQLDFAKLFIATLKAKDVSEVPTRDYKASLQLAGLVINQDGERLVRLVEIFSTFVRISRNLKGHLAFGAVVLDHVDTRVHLQGDFSCP